MCVPVFTNGLQISSTKTTVVYLSKIKLENILIILKNNFLMLFFNNSIKCNKQQDY